MPVKVFILEHSVAFLAVLVLLTILTLVKKMIIQTSDLDDLLALPARRQHRALFPVVNINRFLVEILIILSAEVATFLVHGLVIVIIILLLLHLLTDI